MGGFAVAAEGVVPAPLDTPFGFAAALLKSDEDGGVGGVVMVLEGGNPDTESEDGAGPVTKGVGNGPVPVIEVGDTVCAMVAVVLPAWSIR